MIGVLTSYAQMPFRVQQVPWAEYLVNLEKTSFLWLTCWGPAFIGNILLLIQLYDTFYSSSFASLASSAGAARCFSTKAARSSRSLLPLYSSAWEFRCIWPAHYIYHHFYLFAILVNVESGEAVDTMSTAELPVGIPVGGAVHVPDRHFSSLREGMSQDRVTRSNDSIHNKNFFKPLYFSARVSQVGASLLQWPHLDALFTKYCNTNFCSPEFYTSSIIV